MIVINCPSCGHKNEFKQRYPYHAGFGNQGFLYDDAGTLTLVWDTYDPAYQAIVGQNHPWALTPEQQSKFEDALREAPSGGRWRFTNPARCLKCASPIGDSITETIYYLLYPDGQRDLKDFLLSTDT